MVSIDPSPISEAQALTRPAARLDDSVLSITTYMQDECTRIVEYNGRRLVNIVGRENFSGGRLVRLPGKVIEFASRQPVTSALLPCRVGYFPHASGQKVSRPSGDWSHTLLLCLDGAGWLDLRDSRVRMTRGSCALLRPFEFHAYRADEEKPWSLYWAHFNGRMAPEYYDALTGFGARACTTIEMDVKLIHSFERIIGTYCQGHAYRLLVQASAALHQLLSDVHDLMNARTDTPEDVRSKIQRTIDIMRESPDANISIHEFASAAHMSRMYFAAKFRERTGETPRSFFSKVKIQRACQLLETTKHKVECVAQMVGYVDAFYFSRVFKRITGQTPSEFRHGRGAT